MAFKIVDCDNVRESFTSTGTTITAAGAVANSRALSAVLSNGDTFLGVARKGAEVSVGIFTWSTGGSIAQTTVWYSTNANAAVSFSSGTGEIFMDAPSRLFDHLNLVEASIASASTTALGSLQGKTVQLTGTTTITSFGTGKNKERLVRYTGAGLSITTSSTLVCPGATSLTLATDDIFLAVSDNTATPIWRIMWVRSAASRHLLAGNNLSDVLSATTSRTNLYSAPFDALAYNGMQINGSCDVSQEIGTTGTGTNAAYICDGFWLGTTVAGILAAQASDGPSGLSKCISVTVSSATASPGVSDAVYIVAPIEGYRTARLAFGGASAQSLSIGFWTKIHRTGTYSGSVRNSANNRSYPFTFTQNVADTWEFKTVTLSGDTTGTWLTTNGVGLSVTLAVMLGSNWQGTAGAWAASNYIGATGMTNGVAATSDVFKFTGLIVLPGIELPSSARSTLIMRPFGQEVLLCQRYFEGSYASGVTVPTSGTTSNILTAKVSSNTVPSGEYYAAVRYSVRKRAAPTITIYSYNATSGQVSNPAGGADLGANSGGVIFSSDDNFTPYNNSGGTLSTSLFGVIFHYKADARL